MATHAAPVARRVGRPHARTAAITLALVIGAAAFTTFLWLRAYAPLSGLEGGANAPGDGVARVVDPVTGSGGKTVYFAEPRLRGSLTVGFDLRNTGRFPVRLEGVSVAPPTGAPDLGVVGARLLRSATTGARVSATRPFRPVTVEPQRDVFLVLRYATACSAAQLANRSGAALTSTDAVRVRYRYLRLFRGAQTVELPFAVTLQCGGRLPSSTSVR